MKRVRSQRLIIWAAKGMFKSARKLATALKPDTPRKVLVVRSDSPRFKPRDTDKVINWGNSKLPHWPLPWIVPINIPMYVAYAVNKLSTFILLQEAGVSIPEWTASCKLAQQWVDDGETLVLRNKLTGFGGDDIDIYTPEMNINFKLNELCLLFVKYKKKKHEYRVHVFNGEVIDITQKRKRKDFEGEINTKIRNYANGWVYCREDLHIPEDLRDQAIKAVHALGLDFGAVDIIWNQRENKSYVLEVNTAPGLEGTTLESYKNAILASLQTN